MWPYNIETLYNCVLTLTPTKEEKVKPMVGSTQNDIVIDVNGQLDIQSWSVRHTILVKVDIPVIFLYLDCNSNFACIGY